MSETLSTPHSRKRSPQPEVWIEVSRGRTRFPRRPVAGDRLLIGAGSNCQLQLGGNDVPFLHSILVVENEVSIEAFVPQPELRVNGQPTRGASLHDGDRLAIGAFEFSVHIRRDTTPSASEDLYAPIPLELAHQAANEPAQEDASQLSASELVSRIESLETQCDAEDEGRRTGAAALLDAVRMAAPQTPTAGQDRPPEILLLRDLMNLSQDLERRLTDLRQQEQEHAARAAALLAAQEKLTEQLRAARQTIDPPQTLRASA